MIIENFKQTDKLSSVGKFSIDSETTLDSLEGFDIPLGTKSSQIVIVNSEGELMFQGFDILRDLDNDGKSSLFLDNLDLLLPKGDYGIIINQTEKYYPIIQEKAVDIPEPNMLALLLIGLVALQHRRILWNY